MKTETLCVHASCELDTTARGLNTPIFTSSSFEYLNQSYPPYPRYFNTPNQNAVKSQLCALEGGEDGLIFSSGMAAISTTLLSFLKAGDHAVIQEEIYGGTHAFVSNRFPELQIDFTLVSTNPESIAKAIRPNTRFIYVESPTNPLLTLVDLAEVVQIAKNSNILTVIDNTFASPIHQNPLKFGVDLVVHSGTKYLGGHSDLSCGAVIGSKNLIKIIRKTALGLGGCLHAHDAYLLERSLKTLHLRVKAQTKNAELVAEFLSTHPNIQKVYYPGLKHHFGHELAKRQMSGFGAMLSFELKASTSSAHDFLKKLKLIRPALSLGGIESTICDPVSTSHASVSEETRKRMGISDRLLRLSVGIEHPDDLISDLHQAMTSDSAVIRH